VKSSNLTVIIPVLYELDELKQLNFIITECKKLGFKVIVVVDKHKEDSFNSVIEEWVKEFTREIKIIEGNYSGPGAARNAGLTEFRKNPSKWLTFWDADDLPSAGEIASAISTTGLSDKAMIVGNFTISDTFSSGETKSIFKTKTLEQLGIQGGLWRVVFNFEYFPDFPDFPALRMGEDQVFLSRLVFNISEIEFLERFTYSYRKHSQNQLMNSRAAISEVSEALKVVCQDILDGRPKNPIRNIVFANLVISTILKRNWDRDTVKSVLRVLVRDPLIFVSILQTYFVKLSLKLVKSKSTFVFLTGGLGNQLFQLASGLQGSQGNVVGITSLGSQYRGEGIDIEKFEFPFSNITFRKLERNRLLVKTFNLGIRLSIRKTWIEQVPITRSISRAFMTIYFTGHFKRLVTIHISEGVSGIFDGVKNQSSVLIGYFQNYRNFSDPISLEVLENCHLKSEVDQETLSKFKVRSSLRVPCIVHVRLGDYLSSTDFHKLDKNYYSTALRRLSAASQFSEIWLFSDEPAEAIKYIPFELRGKVYIPEIPLENASLTLEVMKLGECFVIANSTFSWWAAFLRKNPSAKVIAPIKWFEKDSISRPNYPPDWEIL
jgi:glycosyltransferase involved in cell wall biosynthesis